LTRHPLKWAPRFLGAAFERHGGLFQAGHGFDEVFEGQLDIGVRPGVGVEGDVDGAGDTARPNDPLQCDQ
jgi:hypothetical protein